jgi:hypothetical protein
MDIRLPSKIMRVNARLECARARRMGLLLIPSAIHFLLGGTIPSFQPQVAFDPIHFNNYWAAVDIDRYGKSKEKNACLDGFERGWQLQKGL